jgi:hypothetical protein
MEVIYRAKNGSKVDLGFRRGKKQMHKETSPKGTIERRTNVVTPVEEATVEQHKFHDSMFGSAYKR